ncbi:MAG: SDR family NAD(P)-dependent oxidoreductase [Ignavibacteriales bacterium]
MNKVILVTGTRKGIGKSIAEYYLQKGCKVIGISRRMGSIDNENYQHYSLNVSDETLVIKAVKEISKKYGRIDALINNAGVAAMNHLLLTPSEMVKKVFETNYLGTFLFTREVSKIMIKQKYGRIVNFSTVAVALKLDGEAVYASSKAAIENFTKISSKELGSFGITVNAIGPTPIETDLIKNVPQQKIDNLIKQQSIKRFGNFNDVINVIEFFLSDSSEFITGQIVYLGGINS